MFITVFERAALVPISSQSNRLYFPLHIYFTFIFILSYHLLLGYPYSLFLLGFPVKIMYARSLSHERYMSHPFLIFSSDNSLTW
jgi:hypothetical protein